MKKILIYLLPVLFFLVVFDSCKENEPDGDIPVLENKRRVECERRSPVCNGKDAMRLYQSVPLIQQDSTGRITVTDVWSSFVICCDDFTRIMDSLESFNHIFDSASYSLLSVSKRDTIGRIVVSASIHYLDEWSGKRYEWLSFGDSSFVWHMPTGRYFDAHKRELEEAHTRCCLL